jgi:EmrB/QacA subfamily drug resistance transporter
MSYVMEADDPPFLHQAPETGVADARQRRMILIAMCTALVAVIASVSGLNVAQQQLAGDLGATQSQLLWVINGYTIALAALLLPIGAIGDRFGRKHILLGGLGLFSVANVLASIATTPTQLILFRELAGVGAAMIMPVTLSVITTSFPARERARAVGTWAGVAGGGGVFGLFTSAAIIDNATWPWVFAVPVALAVVALLGTVFAVPPSREHADGGYDVLGALLSAVAVGSVVLGVQEGPERGWTAPPTVAAVLVGVVAAVAFVRTELRRAHPLLDVRLFRNRGLATGSVNLFVVFGLMITLFLVVVQLLQSVFVYSALRAASGLMPMAVLMMPLSTIAPTVAHRIGNRRTVATGMVLLATGMALVAVLVDIDRGYVSVLPGLAVLAVGVGLAMSPSTTAITAALGEDKQGVASALNDTARELGAAIGIALFGSILNAQYRTNVRGAAATLPDAIAEPVREGIGGALAVTRQLGPDGLRVIEAARAAWLDAVRPTLGLAALAALAAAVYTVVGGRREDTASRSSSAR